MFVLKEAPQRAHRLGGFGDTKSDLCVFAQVGRDGRAEVFEGVREGDMPVCDGDVGDIFGLEVATGFQIGGEVHRL